MKKNKGASELILSLVVFLMMLQGCSVLPPQSPAPNYYILHCLNNIGQNGPVKGAVSPNHQTLVVGPIEIPTYLQRTQVVIRSKGNGLLVSSFHRWAEPLDSAIERIVAKDIALLSGARIESYPFSMNIPSYEDTLHLRLFVNVYELDTIEEEKKCRLDGEYVMLSPNGDELIRDSFHLASSIKTVSFPEAVRCENGLINQLSKTIWESMAKILHKRSMGKH